MVRRRNEGNALLDEAGEGRNELDDERRVRLDAAPVKLLMSRGSSKEAAAETHPSLAGSSR